MDLRGERRRGERRRGERRRGERRRGERRRGEHATLRGEYILLENDDGENDDVSWASLQQRNVDFLFIDDKKLIIKIINQNNFRYLFYMILTSPWGSSRRSPWGSAWRSSWRSPRTTSRRSSLRRSHTFRRRRTSFG